MSVMRIPCRASYRKWFGLAGVRIGIWTPTAAILRITQIIRGSSGGSCIGRGGRTLIYPEILAVVQHIHSTTSSSLWQWCPLLWGVYMVAGHCGGNAMMRGSKEFDFDTPPRN